jgi:hypothetical protein
MNDVVLGHLHALGTLCVVGVASAWLILDPGVAQAVTATVPVVYAPSQRMSPMNLSQLRCPSSWENMHWSHGSDERLEAIRQRFAPTPGAAPSCCAPGQSEAECFLASVGRGARDGGMDGAFVFPQPGGVHWYTQEEACDVVGKTGVLVLIGDSLTRYVRR